MASAALERAFVFPGEQGPLIGILCEPAGPCAALVLIVAGQPQTRVGSHRMFTELARGLAARGFSSLRFDAGGWGDSPGAAREFERSAPDIASAAAFLRDSRPGAPLWLVGLCDGASASVLALPDLAARQVTADGIVMLNPWVRSEASLAAAMVQTYYTQRLFDRSFWARLLRGQVPVRNLLVDPVRAVFTKLAFSARTAIPSRASKRAADEASRTPEEDATRSTSEAADEAPDLPTVLQAHLSKFGGQILTVLSGNDLTAGETEALMQRDRRWRKLIDRPGKLLRVSGADHTFSDRERWIEVIDWISARIRT